ncbi:hypothetical protein Bca4012_100327 [Brassica carinata]
METKHISVSLCFLIDSVKRTEGNDWSTETSPPPPPGVKYRRKSGGSKGRGGMSVVKGVIIVIASLIVLVLILARSMFTVSDASEHKIF